MAVRTPTNHKLKIWKQRLHAESKWDLTGAVALKQGQQHGEPWLLLSGDFALSAVCLGP